MKEQELLEGLKRIAEAQEATMRQCRIMVAGFKATGEQDERLERYKTEYQALLDMLPPLD